MRLPIALIALALLVAGPSVANAQYVVVPHTSTHTHLVPHYGHLHAVPHTTTHYHGVLVAPRYYPSPAYYPRPIVVPHTSTHTHLVPHYGHLHAVPHTTTHYHGVR